MGICGISLSALAQILVSQGHEVWGSDLCPGEMGKKLSRLGIKVFSKHKKEYVKDADVVVYTAAASKDNPEILWAKEQGKKVLSRAEVLGGLSKYYKNTIAIAGSHGKTTTTGMISTIFINAGFDPTVHIGGNFHKIGGNVRLGKSSVFITEACEYCDSYLKLSPKTGVVLGIQADHLDYFKTLAGVQKSFERFVKRVKRRGALIFNANCARCEKVSQNANCDVVGFSKKSDSDYSAKNLMPDRTGCFSFDCYEHQKFLGRVFLGTPGEHNVSNALAAIAVARANGIDFQTISESLSEFCGVERRFELVGKLNGAKVYHDYAHHPTEISATIATARLVSSGRLFVVFQPHTFSRTKSFFCQFAKSLAKADSVITFPIYPARENPLPGVTSDALASKVLEQKTPAVCLHTYRGVKNFLEKQVSQNDLVLILGAGDIVGLCKLF